MFSIFTGSNRSSFILFYSYEATGIDFPDLSDEKIRVTFKDHRLKKKNKQYLVAHPLHVPKDMDRLLGK